MPSRKTPASTKKAVNGTKVEQGDSVKRWASLLGPFLDANPAAELTTNSRGVVVIERPWGDKTLVLRPGSVARDIASALNAVYLPPALSAIWHIDTKDLEVIWTALLVEEEFRERQFDLHFRGRVHECGYGDASERLLIIAEASRTIAAPTSTNHRNIWSIHLREHDREHDGNRTETPVTSFWIRNMDWEENAVVELCRTLNYYMHYFDRHTPVVTIHEEVGDLKVGDAVRFPFGNFPSSIAARPIDPYLIGLWESALLGDQFRSFLHYYQILEYVAFYYMQDSVSHQIRRILASPQLPSNPQEATRKILDAMVEDKMADEAKIVAVVKELVDAAVLWGEISADLVYFSTEQKFDGGFTLDPLVRESWNEEDFKGAWIPKFPDALRKIRNALVHARESRMVGVIAPTQGNYQRLRRWIPLIASAALQTMLYHRD